MKEKHFYHVVTEKPMFFGQHIIFDNNNHSGVYKRVMAKLNIVNEIYNNPNKYKDIILDHHTKVALRELAMEEVRKEKYPNYPSRLSCLYVSTNLDDALMWADSFIKNGRIVYQIVKLKHNGNEFTGDAYNCFEGSINKEENIINAHNYWLNNKNKMGNNPIYETIIDGDIEVIEIIKEYNNTNKKAH